MLTYKYSAVSKDGSIVSDYIEANNEFDAVSKIKEIYPVVSNIKQVNSKSKNNYKRKISEKSLSIMCSQFSIILGSGVPIVRATELIANQTENKQLKKILFAVTEDVANGYSLADSFANKGVGLPQAFIETVRSGENSGTLDYAFERLKKYYEKSFKIKNKVRSAMIYPTFTIGVAIVVVFIIMVFGVPVFTKSFSELGIELPFMTKALISISNVFRKWWFVIAAVIAIMVILYNIYGRYENGKLKIHKSKLKNPITGKLTRMKLASQFANTLSTLLASGMPMIEAVNITGKVLENYYVSSNLLKSASQLEEGHTLGFCLKKNEYLPDLLIEMTTVGEETGTLETTLDTVGTFYDGEIDYAATKMLALLEPIIICSLAFLVLFILLSVYMPLFTMYGSM